MCEKLQELFEDETGNDAVTGMDEFDNLYYNSDYTEWLEEKLASSNKDYAAALEVYQEFDDYDEDGELVFSDWLHAKIDTEQ